MNVSVSKSAKRDIAEAMAWYEKKQEGLGRRFLDAVDSAIEKIALNPLGYPAFRRDNRRCNLEKFPYALFFKVKDDVIIVACLHGGRDPQLIRERGTGVIEMKKPEP